MVEAARQAGRMIKVVVGFTLLGIGVLLLVLPGPGWATIFLGLALLAAEYAWARRLLDRLKSTAADATRRARRWTGRA